MITATIISQFITLGLDTWQRIVARQQARDTLSQGERIRDALAQTDKNTLLYYEVVEEAKKQIAEQESKIKGNLAELEGLFAKIKTAAKL